MSAELEVLQDAIARLEGAGIAYMLTGSVALSYYAEPRMTRDVDLVVELAGRDPASIVALFAADYYVSETDVGRAIAARTMFNVLHLAEVVKLDFIVRKDTPYRHREFERRKRVRMPGFEAWIVSREDLILSKLAWAKESGSELQLRDVGALLAEDADEAYLRSCAGELSVAALLESCLSGRHDS
ncbi:MAG: nucleotidyl transferase AbiEii/AbiGii toxin family protein [Betaproteobacteria bacterium]